jgi:transcriptional regulator with GAF, ATPase, and Fis domain/predicted negative regulator of RcsB-dependent stress response
VTSPATFPIEAFNGRFEVRQTFSGGEGASALLRELSTGRELVGKVLDGESTAAEASLLQSLRHPAIPIILEVGHLADGRAFWLREFARGKPLSACLPLTRELALSVARQVLEVLAFVHLRGVLHLDLKPANLVLAEDGTVHLLDFGLAVRNGKRSTGGTFFYAPPELLLAGTPSPRSDLFSLGAVLVAALWPKKKPLQLAHFLRSFPGKTFWQAAGVLANEFPEPLPAFLDRCLQREPQRRFPDAQAALEFLIGGAGRPARSLLLPDVVALFGDHVNAAADAAGTKDLLLRGGTDHERELLAIHLLCTRRDVQRWVPGDSFVRIIRNGEPAIPVMVPAINAKQLEPFASEVLGLAADTAHAACKHLLANSAPTATDIGALLLAYADAGLIVPSGAHWGWPQAAQGRLTVPPPHSHGPITKELLLTLATAGFGDAAIARFAEAAQVASVVQELALRTALVRGLIAAGEPARALPFCIDLPVERTQVLLDLGRVADATACLPQAATAAEASTDNNTKTVFALVGARLQLARGEAAAALAELEARFDDTAPVAVKQTKAALLEIVGRGTEARTLLTLILPAIPANHAPYLRAASLTALGHAERRLNNLTEARTHFEDARELLLKLGHARHAATAALNLGLVAKDQHRFDDALDHIRQARSLYQHVDDRQGMQIAEANLGSVALAQGDLIEAEHRLRTAGQALFALGAHGAAAHANVLLARTLALQARGDEARGILNQLDAQSAARLAPEITQVAGLLRAADQPAAPTEKTNPPIQVETVLDPLTPSRELFRTFLAVNRRLAQESDLEKSMVYLLDAAITLTGGREGYLLVLRPDGLQREFQSGNMGGAAGQAFSRSLANRAIQQRRSLTSEEGLADRELQEMPSIRNLQVRSAVCAPFRSASNAEGAIYVEHAGRAGVFSESDKQSLEVLADQAAIAVDRMLHAELLTKELEYSRRELAVADRSVHRNTGTLIGNSKIMKDLRQQILKIGPLDMAVLILGETGTGKELVARAIHSASKHSKGPFVAENCSALPAELMERELFGHVTGSFTGADRDRPGLLELASGGTLFLDEVGDMSPALQSKLLRALQEKYIRRIGSQESIAVDLRVLAATNKDLRAMVQHGEFREDLYYRLAAIELLVPPLRDRERDAEFLALHFVERMCKQQGIRRTMQPLAMQELEAYRWPGNVRELEHVVARAFLLTEGDSITTFHLPRPAAPTTVTSALMEQAVTAIVTASSTEWPAITLAEAERRTILAVMQACHGKKTEAAKMLGISRTSLYEKLRHIEPEKPTT